MISIDISPMRLLSTFPGVLIIPMLLLAACSGNLDEHGEYPADDPRNELQSFHIDEDFEVTLFASEPLVVKPIQMNWDAEGRLWVISSTAYPQLKTGEEPNDKVFILEDTDGDGVADKKERVYYNPERRGGNLEHQQSGLVWNLDNWVYTTYNPVRFKFTKNKVLVDSLDNMPRGQWGLTQDEMGVMYYSAAGSENPAYGFQQPAVYGDYNPEGRLAENFVQPWPIVGTPDVQGGLGKLREDNTLNHFTGVAGQEIFLGHKLPPSVYGDLFIPEPVGRLIRRAKVKVENGKKVLYNAYDEAEFMASTDLNFRPVQAKTGPDGALYIVDMYRGIIQESNWTREGSFLRPVIVRKELDKNIGKGRIYRIVHEDIKPDKKPNLQGKEASELIKYLGHPNGWYRNTAQKLIILKDDQTIVPKLKDLARDNSSIFDGLFNKNKDLGIERVHALWTLEGLGVVDKELIKEKLFDEDPRVRVTAIRLSENFFKNGDTDMFSDLEKLISDNSLDVVNQLALSMRYSKDKGATDILNSIKEKYEANEIVSHSVKESLKKDDSKLAKLKLLIAKESPRNKQAILRGYDSYNELCITCHGADLKGMPTEDGTLVAPSLIGSPRVMGDKGKLSKILLNGLIGPVDGIDYGIMMPLKDNDDQWIADVLTYVRTMNGSDDVNSYIVRNAREESKERKNYWTLKELETEK